MNDIFESVRDKYKKRNKILFNFDSHCLKELINIVSLQNHRTIIMWALDCANESIKLYNTIAKSDKILEETIQTCRYWAQGLVKMPLAKAKILECHRIAKNTDDIVIKSLAHAIGQAGSCVHTPKHAMGIVFYELTAIVHLKGIDDFETEVNNKIDYYKIRLDYWIQNIDNIEVAWAKFLK